ncbi:MAG: hypothetical protein L0312_27180, partial [Acidobacteria bacterium]|nr:hypothetical protein [Acidobacteriota bacterium]
MNRKEKDAFEQLLKNHLSATAFSHAQAEPCPDENCMAAYLEGSQGEKFKKSFEKHLAKCSRCQAELALLLKTGAAEAQPMASLLAKARPGSGLLALLLDWTRVAAFQPAFAVLLVCVVTGVVGYRLLREQTNLQTRPVEMAESANKAPSADEDERSAALRKHPISDGRRYEPSADEDERPAALPLADLKSQEQSQQLKTESLPIPGQAGENRRTAPGASQPDSFRDRNEAASRDREAKNDFSVEPPAATPAESSRGAVGGALKRRDMAVAPKPSPEPLQEESLSTVATDRQNSRQPARTDETSSAISANQVAPRAQPLPAAPPPVSATVALGKLEAEKKVEQDKIAGA